MNEHEQTHTAASAGTGRPRLSLTIPTFNEAANIRIPLASAYDLVDEVVIVDGGSTDDTVEIARSFGEKVVVHQVDNPPNFLQNKQRGIEFATGDWILQLDADEAVSAELADEIRRILAAHPPADERSSDDRSASDSQSDASDTTNRPPAPMTDTPAGYTIPRKNWFLTRYLMKGGVYPDFVTRLYRRDKAHFALKDVHENVIIDGPVAETDAALLHYADPSFDRYLSRWNRYTSFDAGLLVDQLRANNDTLGWQDGVEYFMIKPTGWFLSTYLRHKGFMDGFPGFVFSVFSAIRFWAIYIKAWHQLNERRPDGFREGSLPPVSR